MGLIKERGKIITEEFANSKEEKKENIQEFLANSAHRDALFFIEGSVLNNLDQLRPGLWHKLMVVTVLLSL